MVLSCIRGWNTLEAHLIKLESKTLVLYTFAERCLGICLLTFASLCLLFCGYLSPYPETFSAVSQVYFHCYHWNLAFLMNSGVGIFPCSVARIAHSLLICLLWQIPFFCCHYGRHSVCTPRLACPRLLLRAVAALINRDNHLLRVSVITITVAFCLRFMTCFTSFIFIDVVLYRQLLQVCELAVTQNLSSQLLMFLKWLICNSFT